MPDSSIFPQLQQSTRKRRPERLLLLCLFDHRGAVNVPLSLSLLQRASRFEMDIYNFSGSEKPYRLPSSREFAEYTAVIIHDSLAHDAENLRDLDANLAVGFGNYGGIKVIFGQDDSKGRSEAAAFIGQNGFDVVFIPMSEQDKSSIYPRDVVGDVEFVRAPITIEPPEGHDGLLERYVVETRPAPIEQLESLVQIFDRVIEEQIERKIWAEPAVRLAPLRGDCVNVLLLCAHHPDKDPRIGWTQRNAPPGTVIHVVGVHHDPLGSESIEGDPETGFSITLKRAEDHTVALSRILPNGGENEPGVEEALLLAWLASMSRDQVAKIYGIAEERSFAVVTSLARYFLNFAAPLVEYGGRIEGIDVIIACDLETLLPAVFLKQRFACPLIYDAHEFWPDSHDAFTPAEFDFWQRLERKLLAYVDDAITVTPGLAQFMSHFYGAHFGCVPNCEPLSALTMAERENKPVRLRLDVGAREVAFLVQGQFGRGRGFELLIDAWQHTDARAKLFLRGVGNAYREELMARAAARNQLGVRVFFPDPVQESELVLAASFADVGVIPYEPISINNRHCGPNKLSQYMAAGVPVLSNRLDFVEHVLREGRCGVVADFADTADIVRCVDSLTADVESRRRLGENARAHFARYYNWNIVAGPLYASISALANPERGRSSVPGVSVLRPALPVLVFEPRTKPSRSLRNVATECARALWHLIPRGMRYVLVARARRFIDRSRTTG